MSVEIPARGGPEVRYQSKDGKEQKAYNALEWLAAMGTHVPARGQQSVRYDGFLSHAARGKRRKEQGEDDLPTGLEAEISSESAGKNSAWARLIQKVYEVDPLCCPKCSSRRSPFPKRTRFSQLPPVQWDF